MISNLLTLLANASVFVAYILGRHHLLEVIRYAGLFGLSLFPLSAALSAAIAGLASLLPWALYFRSLQPSRRTSPIPPEERVNALPRLT